MKKCRILTAAVLFAIIFTTASAQGQQVRKEFWGQSDKYLEVQAAWTFGLIDETLKNNPPVLGESPVRKSVLTNLDLLLHDTRNDDSPAFRGFVATRINEVADALERSAKKGMTIYKLYNHTFIVRTPSATVAFDLDGGGPEDRPYIPDTLMQRIAAKCDILLVTHSHPDHADAKVADMFTRAGKEVMVPYNLWEKNDFPYIRHMGAGGQPANEQIGLASGRSVRIAVFPGHQDELPNNIYLVTFPEGYSVAHTGDQSNKRDMEWIGGIKDRYKTDVLLVHCWASPVKELVGGFAPKLVVTGHENEMGHSIDHREPHWLNYTRWSAVPQDKLFMTWGESFLYKK